MDDGVWKSTKGETVAQEAVARSTDPWTSWAAAKSVTGTGKTKAEVLYVLRNAGPLTHPRIVELVKIKFGPNHSESGIRSRVAELVRDGLVKDTGETVKLATGRKAIVWAATS